MPSSFDTFLQGRVKSLISSYEQSVASARAAVLVYDDHIKKWVPSGTSSGLSKVHIYQHTVNGTFRIVGRKLHDHEVVINCAILKGLKYSQATGTFHQWRDNRTVYGLNFSSKDDADNFAVAMLRAIDMLNQNSSTGPRVQQAPPPVPQHASQHAPQHVSQPIYQTIGTVASSQDDTEHQRNWQNQQPVHYMATNAVGSSSHPATPATGPPQAPPPPQAQPQPPQQPQPAVVMGHHRTSSAPGTNGVAPPPPPPAGTSGMSVAVGSMTGVPPPGPPAPPSSGGPTTGAPPPPPPPPPPGGSQGRDDEGAPLSLAAALANAKLKKTSNKVRTNPWWSPIYEGTDTLKKSQGGGSGGGGVPMMGMASMMDEMRGTLAKRRAQAENSQSQSFLEIEDAELSTDSRRAWDKQGSTNGNSPSKVAASGAESPKSGRGQRIGSLGDTDIVKVNGVDALDVDKLKQEIMSEIRREVSKMKQEIIEAIVALSR